MMKCINCGYVTSYERIICPKCKSEMKKVEENNNNGTVILSWKLYVTPDGNEEEYYINLISLNGTKALCKSSSELKEGENVMINGQLCEKIT